MNSMEQVPADFGILIVNGDSASRSIMSDMLSTVGYKVVAAAQASVALLILRERKKEINLILADARSADMPINNFVTSVGEISKSPVLVMLDDKIKNEIQKGSLNGVLYYTTKSLTLSDAKILWKCGKKMINSPVKRRHLPETEDNGNDGGLRLAKRRSLMWTLELHTKFVDAVKFLGIDAVPKRILEHMNVPKLTRQQISSHLQKYRMTLRRQEQRKAETSLNGGLSNFAAIHRPSSPQKSPGDYLFPKTQPMMNTYEPKSRPEFGYPFGKTPAYFPTSSNNIVQEAAPKPTRPKLIQFMPLSTPLASLLDRVDSHVAKPENDPRKIHSNKFKKSDFGKY